MYNYRNESNEGVFNMPKFPEYDACTSILVGKKASVDGSTMIGRNEDCKSTWPKHFVVHPHKEYKEKPVFIAQENAFTMELPTVRVNTLLLRNGLIKKDYLKKKASTNME